MKYRDYPDELNSEVIRKIFRSINPRDTFYEILDEIKEESEESDEAGLHYIYDNIQVCIPYDHFLRQKVRVVILVDTGDWNFDFKCNNLFTYAELRSESSLLWLMKQQGYTQEEIDKFIKNRDYNNSEFLKSIHQECLSTTYDMNTLGFFTKMSLGELLDIQGKDIIIKKDTPCGLINLWNGTRGTLDIRLDKDVVLPAKLIDSVWPNGCRGHYSTDGVHGVAKEFWVEGTLKAL